MRRLGCSIALIAIFASPAFATRETTTAAHDSRPRVHFLKKLPGEHAIGVTFIQNSGDVSCSTHIHHFRKGRPTKILKFPRSTTKEMPRIRPESLVLAKDKHCTEVEFSKKLAKDRRAEVPPANKDPITTLAGISIRSLDVGKIASSPTDAASQTDHMVFETTASHLLDLLESHPRGKSFGLTEILDLITDRILYPDSVTVRRNRRKTHKGLDTTKLTYGGSYHLTLEYVSEDMFDPFK